MNSGFRWLTSAIRTTAILGLVSAQVLFNPAQASEENPGFVQQTINAFESSDFRFQRGISHVPFPPIAFLTGTHYSDIEIEAEGKDSLKYDVDRFSQMAAVPFLLGKRDAVFVGEYVSRSDFSFSDGRDDVGVTSIGLPVGWIRQVNPEWQTAAFVMPLGHDSDMPGSDWDWQYLGGAFARYVQSDTLWWAFGLYADVGGSGDDFYIPYLGASWTIDESWTISAVMPWPAILYAPNDRWMVRLGVSPSGASWSVDSESQNVAVNLDGWDVGLGVEYRLAGSFWLGARAGYGGLRGLRLEDSEVEEPDLDFGSSAFVGLQLNFRPAAL
ncbi:hypothetical protein EY643_15040 [Halioglobus maricola]|uniref:Outer membrane protein beta-barrel domain-containing protein n=1 Tax=Halioglobus maricola TaxID=2601894 RepID=A0A5P9NMK3_9GAMM|nr:outer membrane beta-barrel protein [Halioglobus maricola]QFU76859.1 hypothetical protein EY643_15040 [Halioglobus maricola]